MEPVSKSALVVWLGSIAAATIALLSPIHGLMAGVGFLIFADLLTGVMSAYKRKEPITSKALSRTVYKALAYQIAVVSGFVMQYFLSDALPVAKLVAMTIGLTELKSLAENVKTMTGTDLRAVVDKVTSIGRDGGGNTPGP